MQCLRHPPTKNLVISLDLLADERSQEEHPSQNGTQGDPVIEAPTTDASHDSIGRSVPRKGLKQLIFLSTIGTSCGIPLGKHQ